MSECRSPLGEKAQRGSSRTVVREGKWGEARGHWTHRHPFSTVGTPVRFRQELWARPLRPGLPAMPRGRRRAVSDDLRIIDDFLDDAYVGQERLSSADLQRSAVAAELPATVLTRIDALPEGEYAQDEAAEALRATGGAP